MKRLVILAGALALLTTACELQINLLVDLDRDGGGNVAFQFAADEEMRQLFELGAEGQSLEDLLFTDSPLGELPGAEVREFQDGDLTVFEASATFDSVAEAEALLTGPDNPFRDFSYETSDDGAMLMATIEVPDLSEGADLGIDPATFTEDIFSFNIRIKMPDGSVTSNADSVLSDGTLEWAVPLSGGDLRIEAESAFGGGMAAWVIVLLVVVALSLLVLLAMAVRRRGSKSPDVVSDVPPPEAPDAWMAPPGESSEAGPADPFNPATPPSEPTAPTDEAASEPPIAEPTGEPASEPPIAEPTEEAASEPPIAEPTGEPASEPPIAEPTDEAASEPPIAEPTGEPASEPPIAEPTGDTAGTAIGDTLDAGTELLDDSTESEEPDSRET